MGSTLLDLLPLIVGTVLVPVYVILVLLLLESPRGLSKATAFVAAVVIVRIIQGVLFGLVFRGTAVSADEAGERYVASALLLMLGLMLLVTALRKWRKEEDPDAPPPRWAKSISGLSAAGAAGMGALFALISVKQWAFTLAAISIVEAAELGWSRGIGAYLIFVLATQVLVLPPLLARAVAPRRSEPLLRAVSDWFQRYNRPIVIVVSLVFGAWFAYKGISGLLG